MDDVRLYERMVASRGSLTEGTHGVASLPRAYARK